VVFDSRRAACAAAQRDGAVLGENSAAVAARCEVVIASLPSESATGEALWDPEHGAITGMSAGSVLIDCSTNTVQTTLATESRCRSAGIDFLDCPVSMAGGHADQGALTLMVGGDAAVVEHYRTLLTDFGTPHYFGPVGTGTVAKLVTQYIGFGSALLALEATVAAERSGIDIAALLDLIPYSAAAGGLVSATLDHVNKGDFRGSADQAWAPLYIVHKDMHAAIELAETVGVVPAIGSAATALLDNAVAHGWRDQSFTKAVELVRESC
jgi:3-hydroxyisobutyrate dehydrogenase-like beta-hydroxyacid dehydrogenase